MTKCSFRTGILRETRSQTKPRYRDLQTGPLPLSYMQGKEGGKRREGGREVREGGKEGGAAELMREEETAQELGLNERDRSDDV